MTHPIYSVSNCSYSFSGAAEPIFDALQLDMYPGELIGLIGKSGSGKSTLLTLLSGLASPKQGQFQWEGRLLDPTSVSWRRKHVGMLFQAFHLIEELTVLENILLPSTIAHLGMPQLKIREEEGKALLEQLSLDHLIGRQCRLLSGGEKQRVALVRSVLHQPNLLLCDEPTGNLDGDTAQLIFHFLASWTKGHSKRATLLVTHDRSLAESCDRTILLENGRLINITKT
jgi:ABC-type lipoprotein export system ATPase subunit